MTGLRPRFIHACLSGLLAILCSAHAHAAHIDPAPLPADIANRVARFVPPDPLFQSLDKSLDEAVDLVKQVDTEQRRGAGALSSGHAMLIQSKHHELNGYLTEIRKRMDQQDARLAALGVTNSTVELRTKIEARFKRVLQALDRIDQAPDAKQRGQAIGSARQVLRELYEQPKAEQEPKMAPDAPTWKAEAPRPSEEPPKSKKHPQYLSYNRTPSDNIYAFLGSTRGSALCRAATIRLDRIHQGNVSRTARRHMVGELCSRYSLRRAATAEKPRLHRRGRVYARAWDWCQYLDVQRAPGAGRAAAAVSRFK